VLHLPHSQLTLVPMIEIQPSADKPLPFDMSDEQPKTHKDGIAIAVNTTAALESLGPSIDFADKDLHSASEVINGTDKPNAPRHIHSAAEAKAVSAELVAYMNVYRMILKVRRFHV